VPRHHRTAVDRNRLKRRLRELVRVDLLGVLRKAPAVDVAIRARADAYRATFAGLRTDVDTIRNRLSAATAEA
jgi:ribonuclease P protein component